MSRKSISEHGVHPHLKASGHAGLVGGLPSGTGADTARALRDWSARHPNSLNPFARRPRTTTPQNPENKP